MSEDYYHMDSFSQRLAYTRLVAGGIPVRRWPAVTLTIDTDNARQVSRAAHTLALLGYEWHSSESGETVFVVEVGR